MQGGYNNNNNIIVTALLVVTAAVTILRDPRLGFSSRLKNKRIVRAVHRGSWGGGGILLTVLEQLAYAISKNLIVGKTSFSISRFFTFELSHFLPRYTFIILLNANIRNVLVTFILRAQSILVFTIFSPQHCPYYNEK